MAGLPARRDVLRGAAAVGAFLAVDAAALLTAFNWIGPSRLTPLAFLEAFNNAFGRHRGYRTNHAKGVSASGWFDSMVARVINRLTHHPPAWPSTIGALEGRVVGLSEKFVRAAAAPAADWLGDDLGSRGTVALRDPLLERMTFRFRRKADRSRA